MPPQPPVSVLTFPSKLTVEYLCVETPYCSLVVTTVNFQHLLGKVHRFDDEVNGANKMKSLVELLQEPTASLLRLWEHTVQ